MFGAGMPRYLDTFFSIFVGKNKVILGSDVCLVRVFGGE